MKVQRKILVFIFIQSSVYFSLSLRDTCKQIPSNQIFEMNADSVSVGADTVPGIMTNQASEFTRADDDHRTLDGNLGSDTIISISFYMKIDAFDSTNFMYMFDMNNAPVAGDQRFIIHTQNQYGIRIVMGNNGQPGFSINIDDVYPETNIWYHTLVVLDGSNDSIKAYIDGVEIVSETYTNMHFNIPRAHSTIGSRFSKDQTVSGILDEFVIFDKVINQKEIECLLNKCDALCKECNQSADNCTVCTIGENYQGPACTECKHLASRDINNNCACKFGFYNIGIDECDKCDPRCNGCKDFTGECLQCASDLNRKISSNCVCPHGFFENSNLECLQCDSQCNGCIGQKNVCLACLDTITRDNTCNCLDGYFEMGNFYCQKCPAFCINCISETQCTTCSLGQKRSMIQPECGCQEGFFQLSSSIADCYQCPIACKSCQAYNQCLECADDSLSPPNCQNPEKGFVVITDESGKLVDVQCDRKCESCSVKADNCDVCQGKNRENNAPKCDCVEGFQDENGVLQDCLEIICGLGCKKCETSGNCTQCDESLYVLEENSCVCKPGFQQLGDNCMKICGKQEYLSAENTCQKCYFYQNLCLKKCPPKTEKDGFNCIDESPGTITIIVIVGILLIVLESSLVILYCIRRKKQLQPPRIQFQQIN